MISSLSTFYCLRHLLVTREIVMACSSNRTAWSDATTSTSASTWTCALRPWSWPTSSTSVLSSFWVVRSWALSGSRPPRTPWIWMKEIAAPQLDLDVVVLEVCWAPLLSSPPLLLVRLEEQEGCSQLYSTRHLSSFIPGNKKSTPSQRKAQTCKKETCESRSYDESYLCLLWLW